MSEYGANTVSRKLLFTDRPRCLDMLDVILCVDLETRLRLFTEFYGVLLVIILRC